MADNFYGLTDVGQVRGNNEDTFIAQPVQQNRYILAAVIDGVGGYDGGEIAAEIAREQMIEHLSSPTPDLLKAMSAAFTSANAEIYARKQKERNLNSMACVATLAMVDVQNNEFYYAHVGDTRLYLFRDHSLNKITKDHSFVGFLEDSGRLTESAAMSHPKRNEINKALGFDHAAANDKDYIEIGQSPFLPGDMLLLCSDGLTDMVDKSEITQALSSAGTLEQKAQKLIATANQNGGRDNVTVVLVHNNKKPVQQVATMPITNALPTQTEPAKSETNFEQSPVLNTSDVTYRQAQKYKSNNFLVPALSVLCAIFLAAAIWFYWRSMQQKPVGNTSQQTAMPVKPVVNPQVAKLQDTINKLKGDTLLLSDAVFTSPIMINDTLKISKDTLYIKTKGKITFKKEGDYNGPCIVLAQTCKHIVINGLTLQDFNTGIQAYNNALQLKNIQFTNCRFPVQILYIYTGSKPASFSAPAATIIADTLNTKAKPNTNGGK